MWHQAYFNQGLILTLDKWLCLWNYMELLSARQLNNIANGNWNIGLILDNISDSFYNKNQLNYDIITW